MTGNKHYIPYPVCCIEILWSSIMRASLVQGRMGGGKVPGTGALFHDIIFPDIIGAQ